MAMFGCHHNVRRRIFAGLFVSFLAGCVVSTFGFVVLVHYSYSQYIPDALLDYKTRVIAARAVRGFLAQHVPVLRAQSRGETEVADIFTLLDADSITRRRSMLKHHLWPELKDLPRDLPDSIVNMPISNLDWMNEASEARLITHVQEYGITSTSVHYVPKTPKSCAIIYHAGHKGDITSWSALFESILRKGCHLITMTMPLETGFSDNVILTERFGEIVADHNNLPLIATDQFTPIKLFVQPVVEVVNYLNDIGSSEIHMIGYSGGGWTTSLASAVDSRILNSVTIAGSAPIFIMHNPKYRPILNKDYEQQDGKLLRIANYVELYTLGAAGEGRSQTQYLLYEGGVFPGKYAHLYAGYIQEFLRSCAGCAGSFDTRLYYDSTTHAFSAQAEKMLIDQLASW